VLLTDRDGMVKLAFFGTYETFNGAAGSIDPL